VEYKLSEGVFFFFHNTMLPSRIVEEYFFSVKKVYTMLGQYVHTNDHVIFAGTAAFSLLILIFLRVKF
jgi:hypothetical protein